MQASKTNNEEDTMTTETTETMTPYKAAGLVNKQLADLGIEKKLPPQMLYTYVSKGYIKSVDVDGKKKVTKEALASWFVGYVEKLTNTKVTVEDEVVAEDDGTVGEWTAVEA